MGAPSIRGLRAALGFLTRIPMGAVPSDSMGAAINWFPIVGALIGAVAGGVYAGAVQLVPPLVAAGLALSVEWLITGAFHLDGLGDMADGFGGGWTPERRLEIMKDSRHGTYGVVSMVAVMMLQVTALGSLPAAQGFAALVAANCLGRAVAVVVMIVMRPARMGGLGVDYRNGLSRRAAAVGVVAGCVLVGAVAGAAVLGVLAACALVAAVAVSWLSWRKIAGMAGDVLGAVEQIAATAILIAASASSARLDWPWWA